MELENHSGKRQGRIAAVHAGCLPTMGDGSYMFANPTVCHQLAEANEMPLTALKPAPDFTLTAQASRAWTREVTSVADVPQALAEALRVVTEDKRQALLNIKIIG